MALSHTRMLLLHSTWMWWVCLQTGHHIAEGDYPRSGFRSIPMLHLTCAANAVIPPPPSARPDIPLRTVEVCSEGMHHGNGANCEVDVDGEL